MFFQEQEQNVHFPANGSQLVNYTSFGDKKDIFSRALLKP